MKTFFYFYIGLVGIVGFSMILFGMDKRKDIAILSGSILVSTSLIALRPQSK